MSGVKRRDLLKLGSATAGAVAVSGLVPAASAKAEGALLAYPEQALANAKSLDTGKPLPFSYPDPQSPCVLLKTGKACAGGVGPDADIVAFSILCAHRGCPVRYVSDARTFQCPCHFSIFDPEKLGQMVCGQATHNLPRIVLDYTAASGELRAVAVEGLIYGRASNLLSKEA